MARFAVTGGGGFIGSHLVDRLLKDGHHVVAVDNFVTGSKNNLDEARRNSRFELINQDISEKMPDVGKIDGLFHMASPASPIDFKSLAIPILKVGSYGTFHALEYAKKVKSWFLMASTSEVYGDPLVHPQTEEYLGNVNPVGVRGVYDEAKRFSEAVTAAYRRAGWVETSIVRIFNTYGPRMRPNDGRVIPNFISQAMKGEDLTIYGDGTQTRSLLYVADMIEGLVRFWEKRPTMPINLGNDTEMQVKEIARLIVRLTGSKSGFANQPLPEGDPKQRCPRLDRAKKELGWQPKTSPEAGLTATIEYFRAARN